MSSTDELIAIWSAANEVDIGIRIKTTERKLLQQQLYRARSELGDDRFNHIVIVMPQEEDELILVRRDADETS